MDGVGISAASPSNAVTLANTPVLDALMRGPFYRTLLAHGTAVGMPSDDDMGNSEVGHNALGAGQIFDQGASLVAKAIQNGEIFKNPNWTEVVHQCTSTPATLHFLGLLSDGNVHAHLDHLLTLVTHAATSGVHRVRIHVLLDGRDVDGKSAMRYTARLEQTLATINTTAGFNYKLASGGGRMITTMDRYNADWSIVERGWHAHVLGDARPFLNVTDAIETAYREDPKINDQYIPPFTIHDASGPVGPIQDGDCVICFNFRGDRAIEITRAFEQPELLQFDRVRWPKVTYVGMMQYDGDLKLPKRFLVDPPAIPNPLTRYLVTEGITEFAISETQKFGHVTYFWNGNHSGYIDRAFEEYVEIPSDRLPFDQAPDMKAFEISQATSDLLRSGKYRFGRVNFPNGDMVGHTGDLAATIRAVETTDRCVGELLQTQAELGGTTIILADHGNADEMVTTKPSGEQIPKTSHTLNPVPFAIVAPPGARFRLADLPTAGLANVAATVCNLLGYKKPDNYEPSLITFSHD